MPNGSTLCVPAPRKRVRRGLGALLGVTLGTFAASQSHGQTVDVDGLLTCGVVYSQIATLYAELKRPTEARSFLETSTAYSASALHLAGYSMEVTDAVAYVDDRAMQIVKALNSEAMRSKGGEQAVITAWLPYCDSLAPQVSQMLSDREIRGW